MFTTPLQGNSGMIWIWYMHRWAVGVFLFPSHPILYTQYKYLDIHTLYITRRGSSRKVTQRPTAKLNDCSRHSAYNGRGRRVQIHRRSNHPKLYFYPNQPLFVWENSMQCNILLSRPSRSICSSNSVQSSLLSSGSNYQKEIWCCQVENFPSVIRVLGAWPPCNNRPPPDCNVRL